MCPEIASTDNKPLKILKLKILTRKPTNKYTFRLLKNNLFFQHIKQRGYFRWTRIGNFLRILRYAQAIYEWVKYINHCFSINEKRSQNETLRADAVAQVVKPQLIMLAFEIRVLVQVPAAFLWSNFLLMSLWKQWKNESSIDLLCLFEVHGRKLSCNTRFFILRIIWVINTAYLAQPALTESWSQQSKFEIRCKDSMWDTGILTAKQNTCTCNFKVGKMSYHVYELMGNHGYSTRVHLCYVN